MFKKTVIAGALAAAAAPVTALAADPPPEHTLTGNVGLYSQYIFRGLTQTNREPAIQGGFDYAHKSGVYAGTWASNISWLRDSGLYNAGGSMEWDFYGGWKPTYGDFAFDIGTLYYWYPGDPNTPANPLNIRANTWEIYGAVTWKWITLKYSHSVNDDTFGVREAGGTGYLDLTVSVPLGDFAKEMTGFTIFGHYGMQKYRGTDPRNVVLAGIRQSNDQLYSYNDWKLGISYALPKDFTIGAYYTDTSSSNPLGYGSVAEGGAFPRNIAKGTGTVYLQKTF